MLARSAGREMRGGYGMRRMNHQAHQGHEEHQGLLMRLVPLCSWCSWCPGWLIRIPQNEPICAGRAVKSAMRLCGTNPLENARYPLARAGVGAKSGNNILD